MNTLVWYSFTVKGRFPGGNTTTMSGHLQAADGYPFAAFDKAVATCKEMTPDLIVDTAKPNQVILRKLKRKP